MQSCSTNFPITAAGLNLYFANLARFAFIATKSCNKPNISPKIFPNFTES